MYIELPYGQEGDIHDLVVTVDDVIEVIFKPLNCVGYWLEQYSVQGKILAKPLHKVYEEDEGDDCYS